MTAPTSFCIRAAAIALLGLACGGPEREHGAPAGAGLPDSVTAATAALDTLPRSGATDYVVDSLVRHGDTVTVWTGPRAWMGTDRPTTAVSLVAPARVVRVRQILGG